MVFLVILQTVINLIMLSFGGQSSTFSLTQDSKTFPKLPRTTENLYPGPSPTTISVVRPSAIFHLREISSKSVHTTLGYAAKSQFTH